MAGRLLPGAKFWSARSLLPLSFPQARLRESHPPRKLASGILTLPASSLAGISPRAPHADGSRSPQWGAPFQPASWLGKKRQQAARTPKRRSASCFVGPRLFPHDNEKPRTSEKVCYFAAASTFLIGCLRVQMVRNASAAHVGCKPTRTSGSGIAKPFVVSRGAHPLDTRHVRALYDRVDFFDVARRSCRFWD